MTVCQAHIAEDIIAATGQLTDITLVVSRQIDVSGAKEVNGVNLYSSAQYQHDIDARDAIVRTAAVGRQMEIDRLRELGVVFEDDMASSE